MLAASFAGIDDGCGDWVRAHEALSRLAKERAAADAEEGRWLLAALRSVAHVHLGFGSFGEYIERLFGYQRRSTQEKLRVAEALEALPAMAHSLESGSLSWSAVRELTRVAIAETEERWLEVASGKTVRQLERLVEGKRPGDEPGAFRPPSERRHVLRFEVEPETFALFREAMTELRRRTGSILDDDSPLLSMARHVLGGPGDAGRASYQIALSVCAQCGSAEQQAGGGLVAVGTGVIEQARCDGQHLGYIAPPAANENAAMEGHDAHVGAEDHSHAGDAHMGAQSHSHDRQALPRPATRAKQTIPPALRRAVLRRDHERCQVPGCSHATFVDLHTSRHAPRAASTSSKISSPFVERITALLIAVSSSSPVVQRDLTSDTRTAASTVMPIGRTPSKPTPGYSPPCVIWAFARRISMRCSECYENRTTFARPAPRGCCAKRFKGLPQPT